MGANYPYLGKCCQCDAQATSMRVDGTTTTLYCGKHSPFNIPRYGDNERIAALETELAKVREERDAAVAKEREACARACERLAEERFSEFGVTEPDTNASYYIGRDADEYELRHEEDDACAASIRARSDKP